MPYVEKRFRSLFFAILASFTVLGVTLTIIGATLPTIVREFEWSYVTTGIVVSAGFVGYFLSTFFSGLLVQRLGPKPVVVVGLALQAVALAFFAARPVVLLNLLLNLMLGLGQGSLEVVVNFSVVRMERGGKSRLMNLMHAAFCAGAILGPLAVGRLMAVDADWRTIYRLMAVVALVMAGALLFVPFSRLGGEGAKAGREPGVAELLRHPLLILFFLILLLYVGAELGISTWVAEYFVESFGTSAAVGAYMVSVFWMGLLAGRLGLSFWYRGRRQAELLLVLAGTCTVALLYAVLMKGALAAGVGFFLSGLGYSAIYPVVMALVGERFSRAQGVAVGFVATGGGIGAFAFPFLMAAIADRFGIRRGFYFFVALNVLMTALAWAIIRWTRAARKRAEEVEGHDGVLRHRD